MYQLLIVEDEPLIQIGIKSMLNWSDLKVELCGIASNGQEALDIISRTKPDIVITDLKMPVLSGMELIRICREQYGNQRPAFIILTNYEDFHFAKEALRYQVTDYLVKLELTPDVLRESILRIINQPSFAPKQENTASGSEHVKALQDKFYIRLLNNLFDDREQFFLQSKDLGLSDSCSACQLVYLEMQGHGKAELSLPRQAELFASALQMLENFLVKNQECRIVSLDLKHCAVLFYHDFSKDPDALIRLLKDADNMLHKYLTVNLRGGIGSVVTDLWEAGDSFQYARQAFSETSPAQPFLAYADNTGTPIHADLFNLSLFKDTLKRAYEEFDEEALQSVISQMSSLFRSNPTHYVQALDGTVNVLYLALSLLPDGESLLTELFADYPERYRSVYRQTTVEQIADWLTLFGERLGQVFTERKKDHKNHIVSSVKRYLTEHVTERLSLNEVAAVFSISPNYLSQLFKKYNDLGFNEYVTSLKIKEAKALLADPTRKVYEIADMLGFESAFYFSKVFKKVEGISPSEYQSQHAI